VGGVALTLCSLLTACSIVTRQGTHPLPTCSIVTRQGTHPLPTCSIVTRQGTHPLPTCSVLTHQDTPAPLGMLLAVRCLRPQRFTVPRRCSLALLATVLSLYSISLATVVYFTLYSVSLATVVYFTLYSVSLATVVYFTLYSVSLATVVYITLYSISLAFSLLAPTLRCTSITSARSVEARRQPAKRGEFARTAPPIFPT
jgi:hypothetical protein